MPTRVKICGITRLEDAKLAVELGAAALGFNLYPRSPRYIKASSAAEITRRLPPFISRVGIFFDEPDGGKIMDMAHEAGVNVIQLTAPRFLESLAPFRPFSVIRAVWVGDDFKADRLSTLPADAFLLDASHPTLPGGTGRVFDWSLARDAKQFGTIILAGGLTPENVGRAIREVRPYAVDVATGVESSPGKKDPAKLGAFFKAVEEADREIESWVH